MTDYNILEEKQLIIATKALDVKITFYIGKSQSPEKQEEGEARLARKGSPRTG